MPTLQVQKTGRGKSKLVDANEVIANGQMKPVYLVADIGNELFKILLISPEDGGRWKLITFPHALSMHTEREFATMSRPSGVQRNVVRRFRYRSKRPIYEVDSSDGSYVRDHAGRFKILAKEEFENYYTVGEEADRAGTVDRRTGALKYERGYYAPLLIGALIELFPEGHNNINIMGMFPPKDAEFIQMLEESLGGTHHVFPTGSKSEVKYVVRKIRTIDEPVGGLLHKIIGIDGETYEEHGLKGNSVLIIDIGGQISTMCRASREGDVDYSSAQSFDLGIRDVLKTFSSEMRARYPEFKTNISQGKLRETLRTGRLEGGGRSKDVSEVRRIACTQIINQIRNIYENEMGGPIEYDHIVLTGGGGALLEEMLRDILNHDSIIRADPKVEDMFLANVRGAAKAYISILVDEKLWPKSIAS